MYVHKYVFTKKGTSHLVWPWIDPTFDAPQLSIKQLNYLFMLMASEKTCYVISILPIRQISLSGADYCPPELYTEGKFHGNPATVSSLGVLLFLLVCGHFPKPYDLEMIYDGIWSDPGLSNGKMQFTTTTKTIQHQIPRQ